MWLQEWWRMCVRYKWGKRCICNWHLEIWEKHMQAMKNFYQEIHGIVEAGREKNE